MQNQMLKPFITFAICLSLPFWCALSSEAFNPQAASPGESVTAPAEVKHQVSLHGQVKKQSKYPIFIVTNRQVSESAHGPIFTSHRAVRQTYAQLRAGKMQLLQSKEKLLDGLQKTGAKRIAVFVHGYRKSFGGSLEFAEKIGSEIDLPVVLFAWPSKNKYSAYMSDECTAEWSSHQLSDTLKSLGEKFGNENVCVMSHSLGARMVHWAFRILASENQMNRPFACNLMFSPDFDRDTFLKDSAFLNRCSGVMKIYLDAHDSRIWLSRMLHGSPRVGTSDGSVDNETLQKICQFNSNMPNHHIPYDVLNAAFNILAETEVLRN
ncbi:MAG: hypothetical protein C0507_22555 [Cyanobacteria bacterium PR.3.49]|nr:hypothetical protein [Cyanobacteria bacterium PR.3.49]